MAAADLSPVITQFGIPVVLVGILIPFAQRQFKRETDRADRIEAQARKDIEACQAQARADLAVRDAEIARLNAERLKEQAQMTSALTASTAAMEDSGHLNRELTSLMRQQQDRDRPR